MSPPTLNEVSEITLPLHIFVPYLIGHGLNGFRVVDQTDPHEAILLAKLRLSDPTEIYVHIENPGDRDNQQTLTRIWYKKDWLISEEKWNIDKAKEQLRRAESNRKTEKVNEIIAGIKKKFDVLDDDTIKDMAVRILSNGNHAVAKEFGVEL